MCAVWCSYISTDLSSFLFATRCLRTLNFSAFCIWSRINSKLFFLRLRTESPSTESCPEKEGGAGLKQPHRNLGFTFPAKGSETVRKGERLSPAQTSPVPRRCLTGGPSNAVQNVLFWKTYFIHKEKQKYSNDPNMTFTQHHFWYNCLIVYQPWTYTYHL